MKALQPPRTSLLAPSIGLTTGASREGLHSIFRRLCEGNQLTVNDVFSVLIAPPVGSRKDRLATMANAAYLFNRGCAASDRLANRIRELTTLGDLLHFTLRGLIELRGVGPLAVSHYRKWCSECYERDLDTELGPYDRLLWSIDAVKACTSHSTQLQFICPVCGDGPFPMLTGSDISGRCPRCLAWLGGKSVALDERRDEHSRFLLWTAKSYTDLLDAPLPSQQDVGTGFTEFLAALSARHYNGVYAHLARAIERNKSVVATWTSRRSAPSWQALCEISFVFHIPISEILLGQTDAIEFSTVRRLPLTVAKRFTHPRKLPEPRSVSEIQALLARVESGEALNLMSLQAIATRFGIHPRHLRRLLPEETARISKVLANRRAVRRETIGAVRQQLFRKAIPDIVSRLISNRGRATRRAVDKELSIVGLAVGRRDASFVRELVQVAIATTIPNSGI